MVDQGDGHVAVHVAIIVFVLFRQHVHDRVQGLLHEVLGVSLLVLGVEGHLHGAVHRVGEAQQLDAAERLGEEGDGQFRRRRALDARRNAVDGAAVGFLAGRVGIDPGRQIALFLLLAADDVEGGEGFALADPLLPAVGGAGVLVGVLQADLAVGAHGLPEDVLADAAGVNTDVIGREHVLELRGGLEALRAARVAHDHGEIAFLHALEGDVQELARAHRDIAGGIVGGLVVRVGIDAEHGEVAGVARPHPVVGVAAELAGRCGRSAHEAHITVDLGDDQVLDVVVVEADDAHLAVRIGVLGSVDQLLAALAGRELVGHVGHALQEAHGQARAGDLLVAGEGEIAVLEVVVLRGGECLDIAVAAVVVGHQQAAAGDDLGRAAAAELDDGVLDGRVVHAVDLLRSQPGAQIAQGVGVHFLEQGEEPHALVGAQGGRHQEQGGGNS